LFAVVVYVTAAAVAAMAAVKNVSADDDCAAVRSLDAFYQAAVKAKDVAALDRLLAADFILVTGAGKTFTKTDLLNEARRERIRYEKQDDSNQTVRLWGDTAVITAKLWMKGTEDGRPFDKRVWFSDTYVRTPAGWKYVFGQSSPPLPNHVRDFQDPSHLMMTGPCLPYNLRIANGRPPRKLPTAARSYRIALICCLLHLLELSKLASRLKPEFSRILGVTNN